MSGTVCSHSAAKVETHWRIQPAGQTILINPKVSPLGSPERSARRRCEKPPYSTTSTSPQSDLLVVIAFPDLDQIRCQRLQHSGKSGVPVLGQLEGRV